MQVIRPEIAIIGEGHPLRLLLQSIVRSYFLDTIISTILAPKVNILFGIPSCRLTRFGTVIWAAYYTMLIPEVFVSNRFVQA